MFKLLQIFCTFLLLVLLTGCKDQKAEIIVYDIGDKKVKTDYEIDSEFKKINAIHEDSINLFQPKPENILNK